MKRVDAEQLIAGALRRGGFFPGLTFGRAVEIQETYLGSCKLCMQNITLVSYKFVAARMFLAS